MSHLMTARAPDVSVIIPAHDEAGYIGACLKALLASDGPSRAEILVIANGCRDDTAAIARGHAPAAARRGWTLRVQELVQGGKPGALNAGDAAALGAVRVYLDADVTVSEPLLAALVAALDGDAPLFASGRPVIAPSTSGVTRRYAGFWARLPFASSDVPGFGLYAMNAAGRARRGVFPDIISDDTFARLHFAPSERLSVPQSYSWPMVEGFGPLVRVRRRQDRGVAQIARLYPALVTNDDTPRAGLRGIAARALRDPAGFAVYAAVALATRLRRGNDGWARGR